MKYRYLFIIALITQASLANSQVITGMVMSDDEHTMTALPGASVVWLGTTAGVVTDEQGNFTIEKTSASQQFLRFSFVGYQADTVEVGTQTFLHIMLVPENLEEVIIAGEVSSTAINTTNPVNMETLTKKELLKAACCNLSESFETNATVDAEFSDAVTGARTIKLLGLDGVYSQIMVENMPNVRGLSSSYGLTYIPGPWIESIQVTKGPGSVVNGYEGLTGSINTELKKPYKTEDEQFSLNLYGSNSGRVESHMVLKHLFSEKWSTAVYTGTSNMQNRMDHNGDTFLDMPLNNTYTVMNSWDYFSGKVHEAQIGIKYIYSDLLGGQDDFNQDAERTTENGYGVNVHTNRVEAYMKNGFVFKRPSTSIGTIVNYAYHDQQAYFGLNDYAGIEHYANVNIIGQTYLGNTNHTVKAGMSYLFNDFNEQYNDTSYLRTERVPGVFGEYYYNKPDKWSLLAGVRADFHNLYGTFVAPRLHLKYNVTPKTTLRMSAGKAYRVANVLAENTTLLTTNREIVIANDLLPEEGWNYGLTLIRSFMMNEHEGTVTIDAYRTDFVNQVVVDVDSSAHEVFVTNLEGRSFSNILQATVNYEVFRNFEMRLAYKYTDARTSYHGELLEVPLTFRNRGLVNLAYKTKKEDWHFDATMQYYGASRLPDLEENHSAHELDTYSPEYVLFLAQVTKKFKWFDIYLGSENLTNYTQHMPVIGYDDPFGEDFDASVVYAPIMERKFYLGFRMTLK